MNFKLFCLMLNFFLIFGLKMSASQSPKILRLNFYGEIVEISIKDENKPSKNKTLNQILGDPNRSVDQRYFSILAQSAASTGATVVFLKRQEEKDLNNTKKSKFVWLDSK